MHPVLLIAATITTEGHIDLPATRMPGVRALFWPGEYGQFLQRLRPEHGAAEAPAGSGTEPLDMTFFAACLNEALGPLTPRLFQLSGEDASSVDGRAFVVTDEHADRRRLQLIRNAYNAYLLAYEEHLV